jgi:hypothetical protein
MKIEDAFKYFLIFFFAILLASLFSALLGGVFAFVVALISPDFISDLFCLEKSAGCIRYSFAVGMIFGLFIGVAVSSVACILAVVIKIVKSILSRREIETSAQI